jgi:Mrp family chromosome partitioning ATPase
MQQETTDNAFEQFLEKQILDEKMQRIRHRIIVLSGKGGVGKSTVAANLAVSLSLSGKHVGLLDVDIHGPSIPKLLRLDGASIQAENGVIQPVEKAGLKVMSIGFLLRERDDAVIWRGPMKMSVISQFLKDVDWGELDYLVIDCPPGTGDEPLLPVGRAIGRRGRGYNTPGSRDVGRPEVHHVLSEIETPRAGGRGEHERICLSEMRRGHRYF